MATSSSQQREKVTTLVKQELCVAFGIKGPKLKTLLSNAIKELKPKHGVKDLKSHSHWGKIFNGVTGTDDIDYWIELEKVVNHIIEEQRNKSTVSKEKLTSLHKKINSKILSSKAKIKFGYFPNQDTILPLFFRHSYNRNLEVHFVRFENWSDGLTAFKENKVNVALRDFATALSFNSQIGTKHPLFFYPLFSFNGYFIFVKKNKLKEIATKYHAPNKPFHQLPELAKRELFESKSNKIILERKTDFEWAVINFCEGFNCDIEKVKANFIDWNTIDAKREFLAKEKYVIHCTNPINSSPLLNNPKVVSLGQGDSLSEHHNFNGILCTIDFLNKNEDAVAQLIATWFNDIVLLKRDLKKGSGVSADHSELLLPSLAGFLSREIPSEIESKDLLNLLGEGHNTFYDTPEEAFNKFYKEVLKEENKIFENYQKISLIQLGKEEDTDNEVLRVMNLIKNHMSTL